jgi:rhodanese-related sulfurtransferase
MKKFLTLLLCFSCFAAITKAQDNYNEISLPELMKKKQQGDNNVVIVDVRTRGEYHDTVSRGRQSNIGKIKGAVNIPLQELQQNPDAIKQFDAYKDKDIYLLCSHSYRSRTVSNLLLKNGFTNVNNVRGGMTEWYRRSDELLPYRDAFLETSIPYKNISAAQVADHLFAGKKILLIGIASTPRFAFDSATIKFYQYFPAFKDAVYFAVADSLKILETVNGQKNQQVVLFNTVNNGAAELAGWLVQKGITDVSYLVGGTYYFYEYIRNKELDKKAAKFINQKSAIDFISSVNYCKKTSSKNNMQLIDLRHDTLFNKVTDGIKNDYRQVKNSVNFFADKGVDAFVQAFPDKKKEYVLASLNGTTGLELADALTKKGYKISWLMGGLQRLEWYTINMEDFNCSDILVK